MQYKIRKKCRKFKYWLMKKLCSEDEWKTLLNIRVGFHNYPVTILESSFEVNKVSYEFLHSDDGKCKYDAKYGLARQLLKENEEELIRHSVYTESWNNEKQVWVCTAKLSIAE